MQQAHNEVWEDITTVFVRFGTAPVELELMTPPDHNEAFLASAAAAAAAREKDQKKAEEAAEKELQ
eukprot:7376227-Prymnesium_polylepis.1